MWQFFLFVFLFYISLPPSSAATLHQSEGLPLAHKLLLVDGPYSPDPFHLLAARRSLPLVGTEQKQRAHLLFICRWPPHLINFASPNTQAQSLCLQSSQGSPQRSYGLVMFLVRTRCLLSFPILLFMSSYGTSFPQNDLSILWNFECIYLKLDDTAIWCWGDAVNLLFAWLQMS